MGRTLRILIVEDVEDHALLLVRELQKAGVELKFQRVETLQELERALEGGIWDAVISDYNLQGFDGMDALRTVQQKGLDLPFILISGAVGEEKAAEAMKAGAHDYIRKGNYARLPATLEREMLNARIRHERRQTAEELMRHREHLEELVQERTEALVRANELYGYLHGYPMTYQAFLDAIHEEDRQRIDEAVRKSLQEKSGYFVEMRVVLPDRQVRWVMSKGHGYYDEKGKPVWMHGIAMDITERMRAEEEIARLNVDLAARVTELEQRNQELEAFNRMVSHDLRQPLNAIAMACQELEVMCSDQLPASCKTVLQLAYKGTIRMNNLIKTLLKFAGSTHCELRREPINLSDLATEIVAEARLTEPGRKVTFKCAQAVTTDADSVLLRTVLENLIGNARKYTGKREEGFIEFGSTEIDGSQAYFVRDNGKGFEMADADKLFIPFQRLPDSEQFKGSGIGLATVERIIRRHGGRIWAEGEPDKGAVFYFTLDASAKV